nr:LD-carboxypeptidase [Pandoraea horticolens]
MVWGTELMHLLSKLKRQARVKPVIGYSDVTALHLFFNHVWNWPTLHGIELCANGDIGAGWN